MMRFSCFHIHGDNIVECERTLNLIKTALLGYTTSISGPNGSVVCPMFQFRLQGLDDPLRFTCYPGFGRWDDDILAFIRDRGGTLREAADAIITEVSSKSEEPLLAIEYCGALPAGNQAWQRQGRAYSFGLAHVPYIYVAELGGYELDAERNRKAPRMPNPAVPFSFLSYSIEQRTPVLPVFVTSPGADETSRRMYADVFADEELITLSRAILLNEELVATFETISEKVLLLVMKRAAASQKGRTLTPRQWEQAHAAVQEGQSLLEYLVNNAPLSWSKTAYIKALTDTARRLMQIASEHAIGLTSTELPMCIIPCGIRKSFATRVSDLYGNLPQKFVDWLGRERHLAICWVMGFKPRGDDARPDRGLPPLTRMLVDQEHDLLSVVYGPAPVATWPMLKDNPAALPERNGLWEAIFAVSDALLVDTATDQVTSHGFLRSHWEATPTKPTKHSFLIKACPIRFGENDVDTVLHTLFAHYAGSESFEGMCNPPGGDWSGVSLQPPDRSLELRWLSLPRVSGSDTKRPDHVFQLFNISSRPTILSVESKEKAQAVETAIGPRLSAYIAKLIQSPASIERPSPAEPWRHSAHRLDPRNFHFASAVAFIPNTASHIRSVIEKASADLVMAFTFHSSGRSCGILLIPGSKIGAHIADYVSQLNLSETGISIRISQ